LRRFARQWRVSSGLWSRDVEQNLRDQTSAKVNAKRQTNLKNYKTL